MARTGWRRLALEAALVVGAGIASGNLHAQSMPRPPQAPPVVSEAAPAPTPLTPTPATGIGLTPAPRDCPSAEQILQGPMLTQGQATARLKTAAVEEGDHPLPINFPTALRLADAQPLLIAAAQANLRIALAQWQRARVLWIPNINVGSSYLYHAGGSAGNRGPEFINARDQLLLGAGPTALFAVTDAIFSPLAQRQLLRAREMEMQAARNDALLDVAEAYFNVQQARGRLSGVQEALSESRKLVETVRKLASDLTSPVEINRARAQMVDLEREAAVRYQDWRSSSADLTRELRINPLTVVTPLEPPSLLVTLISPREVVDELVPIGLTNRPELAAHQALVQETLVRLRTERLRPLIPSVVLAGNAVPVAPFGNLMGGAFYSDYSGQSNPWSGRIDPNVQVYWTLENFGFGNRALVREQAARRDRALVELFRIQDRVASEVVQAHARVQSALVGVNRSEAELRQAQITYRGSLKGITETIPTGERLVLVNRPLEAVDALRQVMRAYDNYFVSIGNYNRAQFQLFRALGYPARILTCERTPGEVLPVDTWRPPQMAPVQAPPPCQGCPH
jgi:outer membrane protein TolC